MNVDVATKISGVITKLGFPVVMALLLGYALFIYQREDIKELELMIKTTHTMTVNTNQVVMLQSEHLKEIADCQKRQEAMQLRLWRQICVSLSITAAERRACMAE